MVYVPVEADCGEDFTLTAAELGCGTTEPGAAFLQGAFTADYDWERALPLSGLTLRCAPETEEAAYSVWGLSLRWNHSLDIPVTIPE